MKSIQDLTEEQQKFIVGQRLLRILAKIEKKRRLTLEEELERNDVLSKLFGVVQKYAFSLILNRICNFRTDTDALPDIYQEICVIFFKNLYRYNPYQSTPTTFFKPYFLQAINTYLNTNSQHLSSYDAKLVTKVKKAIVYFESQSIKYDNEMLMNCTGLSSKIIRNTQIIMNNSIYGNIDDIYNVASNSSTPEAICIEIEQRNQIIDLIRQKLNTEELHILDIKLFSQNRILNNAEVSKITRLPTKYIEGTWKNIKKKLKTEKLRKLLTNSNVNIAM